MDVLKNSDCRQNSEHRHFGSLFDGETEFCAMNNWSKSVACEERTGSPVVCINDHNEPVLTGLASWTPSGCKTQDHPFIYAKVSAIHSWIEKSLTSKDETKLAPAPEKKQSFEFETGPEHMPSNLSSCSARARFSM